MQALHGGKATHDQSDAQNMAGRLRGGLLPQADVYPAARRATRDLRRRRVPRTRTRAEVLTPVQHTTRQSTLPELGQTSAYTATRDGVAERCPDPAVQTSIAVDLALMGPYAHVRRDVALAVLSTAQPHEAHTLSR